jgi:glycosyltransferase involved in cell wall biosynthesis
MKENNITRYKIVYCTPALYMAGGVERALSIKANYFSDKFGYDITIILTEGADKPLFYPLSSNIKVVNLNIGFEELWKCSFLKKVFVYLIKQHRYKRLLNKELLRIRPDITVSLLRREINFLTELNDGSKKIGELHINRANYRNFAPQNTNCIKTLFSKLWMRNLVGNLKKLDKLVVLTDKDMESWFELNNVYVIPDPLSFKPSSKSNLSEKKVIAIGRYSSEKGYDMLLSAWQKVAQVFPDWRLEIYGDGNREPLNLLIDSLNIDKNRCVLNGRTNEVEKLYTGSSVFVCSSRFEGFGMVILEAMACGLPVVSFDCPWGPRSIITNYVDGILVENGNVEKLAENMILLMSDKNKRIEMSNNAIRNVQRYNVEEIAKQWKSLFDLL